MSKSYGERKKRVQGRAGGIGNHNTAPSLGQISPDLSVYQNPVSELYTSPSQHHRVPWLINPQFPHHLAAFQLTCPSQLLTTEGLVWPRKGNSSLLSPLAANTRLSSISIGDSLDPSLASIGFSGVPGVGTGGGGDGDQNGGRTGKGSGESCHARPLWFFLKCIQSCCDFFMVRTLLNSIVAFAFCFRISFSIHCIVEWRWLMVSIFWKAIHPSNSPMSSLKFSWESKITSRDSRFQVCHGCST